MGTATTIPTKLLTEWEMGQQMSRQTSSVEGRAGLAVRGGMVLIVEGERGHQPDHERVVEVARGPATDVAPE